PKRECLGGCEFDALPGRFVERRTPPGFLSGPDRMSANRSSTGVGRTGRARLVRGPTKRTSNALPALRFSQRLETASRSRACGGDFDSRSALQEKISPERSARSTTLDFCRPDRSNRPARLVLPGATQLLQALRKSIGRNI